MEGFALHASRQARLEVLRRALPSRQAQLEVFAEGFALPSGSVGGAPPSTPPVGLQLSSHGLHCGDGLVDDCVVVGR